MISKTYILENLRRLDASYRAAVHPKHAFYFSKLSILELCGWIEMSMDEVIMCHSRRKVRDPENLKFVEKQIVKRTYGFDHEAHFRSMLIRLVGIVTIEEIEKTISVAIHTKFVAELSNLKSVRDSLAHTYVKQVSVIDAPSTTRARFNSLWDGLKAYDDALRRL